jgi:hypothetical protein
VPLAQDMQAQELGACYCFPSVDAGLEYCEHAYLQVTLGTLCVDPIQMCCGTFYLLYQIR